MEILKGFNFKVSHPGWVAWGGALCGLDSGVFASAVSLVGQERGFGDAALSAFAGIGFFGTFLATVVGGWLADRFGRKAMVVAGSVLYLAGAVLLVAGSSVSALLYAGRAAGGVGLGFLYLAIPLYLSETAPAASRGRKVGAFQLLMTGGMLVGAVVAFGMTRAWMCFAVPAALAAAFAAFAFGLPTIPNPPPARTKTSVSGIASPSSAAALGLAIAIGALVPLSGIGPVLDYSVSVFQRAGMDGFGVHGVDVLIKGVNFALTFPALLLADRLGRRALMIGGSFFMALALAFSAAAFAWGGTDGAGLAAVGCLVYIAAFAVGPGVCMWLVIPELLPGPIRARGLSAALLADYASVTAIVTAFLPLVGRVGLSGAFAVLAVFSATLCAVSALCLRETRGKEL